MTDYMLDRLKLFSRLLTYPATSKVASTLASVQTILHLRNYVANLIIVKDRIEARPIAVEEIFVAQRIVIAVTSTGVAKQSVGEPKQRLKPRLEPEPADVDHDTLGVVATRVARGRRRRQPDRVVEIHRLAIVVFS
jgi:hypothetical protein